MLKSNKKQYADNDKNQEEITIEPVVNKQHSANNRKSDSQSNMSSLPVVIEEEEEEEIYNDAQSSIETAYEQTASTVIQSLSFSSDHRRQVYNEEEEARNEQEKSKSTKKTITILCGIPLPSLWINKTIEQYTRIHAKYIKPKLPTFKQMRKTLKGAIALLLATIIALHNHTRQAVGSSILLLPITMVFYFPVRAMGVQIEAVLYGTLGALISAGWSILGAFLASLAKDEANPTGTQPGTCAILAVFLFIGTFILMYVRRRYHSKANFACVNACNLLVFAMTESAVLNRFDPGFIWSFFIPIAVAGALAIAVDVFLWPEDSFSRYLTILEKVTKGYNSYFKENSEAFVTATLPAKESIASLQSRLKDNLLLLIDCKRAAQREVLYTRVSAHDLSELTRIIKGMRQPLHGIGLSVKLRYGLLEKGSNNPFLHDIQDIDAFKKALLMIQKDAQELTDACHCALQLCLNRVKMFHGGDDKSITSDILWPFPRLFTLRGLKCWIHQITNSNENTNNETNDDNNRFYNVQQRVSTCLQNWQGESTQQAFNIFIKKSRDDSSSHQHHSSEKMPEYGPIHLIALYEYSLRTYATNIVSLLHYVNQFNSYTRHPRQLRPPSIPARKWFRPEDLELMTGDDPMSDLHQATTFQSESSQEGFISRTVKIPESERQDFLQDSGDQCGFRRVSISQQHHHRHHHYGNNDAAAVNNNVTMNEMRYRDPDVNAPNTKLEWMFYGLHATRCWFSGHEQFTALKAATGVVLLAIPAWRTNTAQVYYDWRGQWALVTMVLWMFPTTGRFVFLLIMRVCGSIFGCIAGIIIWEISRGNPYGIAVMSFIFFVPLYYIFFFKPLWKVATFLAKVTLLLVIIYEYNYVEWGRASNDPVYIVAGKRVAMIFLGLISSTILSMIPHPITGRVELRKRLAKTIHDIGRLYGILVASYIVKPGQRTMPTETQMKQFRKLTSELQRQISDERNLLEHVVYEPPLRGKFPIAEYKAITDQVDSMANLVHAMGRSVLYINPEWKQIVASALMKERPEYVCGLAAIMTTIKLISATLTAKTTLPPYMVEPHDVRAKFTANIERRLQVGRKEMTDPTFTRYCTYMLTSSAFVNELQNLLNTVKQLVGVEDPNDVIYLHY